MPQDGANNYYYPPGTPGITDQTIESEAYNTFLDDLVVNDLNIPRPIHRGGTGANNAATALTNLQGEISKQVVSNYDSHPWQNGSFMSHAGATAAPTSGDAYTGTYIEHANTDYATIEARTIGSGVNFLRIKAGTWGPWIQQISSVSELDARYVNVGGDILTGSVVIQPATGNAGVALHVSAPGYAMGIQTAVGPYSRWLLQLGNGEPETFGTNQGSNLSLYRFSDNGGSLGGVLYINRQTGASTFYSAVTVSATLTAGDIHADRGINEGVIYFGSNNLHYLHWDGASYNFAGGPVTASSGSFGSVSASVGVVTAGYLQTNDYVYFGPTRHIRQDGTTGGLLTDGNFRTTGTHYFGSGSATFINPLGPAQFLDGVYIKSYVSYPKVSFVNLAGTQRAYIEYNQDAQRMDINSTDVTHIRLSSTNFAYGSEWGHSAIFFPGYPGAFVNAGGIIAAGTLGYQPGGGVWGNSSSDARVKNIQGDYEQGLDAICKLRPKRYTYKGNGVPDYKLADAAAHTGDGPNPASDTYSVAKSGKIFYGLIAQETETVMPEMVFKQKGQIDGKDVTDLRGMDTNPLIYALINSCKELAARVEALEAQINVAR